MILAEDGGPGFGVRDEVLRENEGALQGGEGRAVDFVFRTFVDAADPWDAKVKT